MTRRRRFCVDPLAAAWFAWCSVTGTAHVCIWKHPRRASAFVALDMATTDLQRLDDVRLSAVVVALTRGSRRGALVNDRPDWPSSDRVFPQFAEDVAARIVAIVRAEEAPGVLEALGLTGAK